MSIGKKILFSLIIIAVAFGLAFVLGLNDILSVHNAATIAALCIIGGVGAIWKSKEKTENEYQITSESNIEMIFVEGGSFIMGCNNTKWTWEKPEHKVTLDSFYIGKHPVTQLQWQTIMGDNPSFFKRDDHPVENVSWNDVSAFISKLNQKTNANYRLPTEAEWEFAAKGGNKSQGYKYSGSNNANEIAWFMDNSGDTSHSVSQKKPNELGIFDMNGNVYEWCMDYCSGLMDPYPSSPQVNPIGIECQGMPHHIMRGGSWYHTEDHLRLTHRLPYSPGSKKNCLGFRLAHSK